MSFVVVANSTRVILPLRTRYETPSKLPILAGIIVSQAKYSGHCLQTYIELGASGLPRPFKGERWSYEWRSDGDNVLACWLGFPNVFFSGGIDPNLRVGIEALGRFGTETGMLRSFARISVTIKADEMVSGSEGISWMPDERPKIFI